MTETEILRQIVQKQDELITLTDQASIRGWTDIMWKHRKEFYKEIAELRQQLEKSKETKLSIPLDVPSKKEIIQSVEYIFENTKRIHGNSEALDWQKIAIHKSVEYILSLPLDVPTDEEIESTLWEEINIPLCQKDRINNTDAYKQYKETFLWIRWAIEEIKRRNE